MKKVFVTINLPKKEIVKILGLAGYEKHHKHTFEYIRDLNAWTRFHITGETGKPIIHMDKTSRTNMHYVAGFRRDINEELERLDKIYREIKPIKPKRKHKDVYAPNLRELQRNHKTKIKRPFWVRIFDYFR